MNTLNKEFFKYETFNENEYNYKQSEVSAGIVHIGVGNFHRSHQASYLDALFNKRKNLDFGILGAGLRSSDEQMRSDLQAQDFLSTVVSRDSSNTNIRVLQSMVDFLAIDAKTIVSNLVKENIKILSLTITEGGYYLDSNSKFNIEHSDIQEDIKNFKEPKTVFGVMLLAIKKRKDLNIKPFTLMSCDNISHNGDILKNIMIKMSEKIDMNLCSYIKDNILFPNSMVDRITPALSSKDQDFISKNYKYEDKRPVFCEPFTQWILEDKFCNARPALEEVGVLFVEDIEAYELMKLRILNGSHSILSGLAALLDIKYVYEALDNKIVRDFLDKIIKSEVIPALNINIDEDLNAYYESVLNRFSNPFVEDTITRICIDNSNKYPKFVIDSIKDALQKEGSFDGLALVCAILCRYSRGFDENNKVLEINDPRENILKEQALKAKDEPEEFLKIEEVFGDLKENDNFVKSFTRSVNSIYDIGVKDTVEKYNNK